MDEPKLSGFRVATLALQEMDDTLYSATKITQEEVWQLNNTWWGIMKRRSVSGGTNDARLIKPKKAKKGKVG